MVGYRPGAPRKGQGYRQPQPQYSAQEVERAFKTGVLIGVSIALLVCAAVIWFWAVPTVEGAVEMARQAVAS